MTDITKADTLLHEAAQWLIDLPEPTHAHLAAAATLLLEAYRVRDSQDILQRAASDWTAAHNGMGLPMPAADASLSAPPADVSRETSTLAERCHADWGSATASQRCVLTAGHAGDHQDSSGYPFPAAPDATEIHH